MSSIRNQDCRPSPANALDLQSDGAISTGKTLALGSLCIPFGACITLVVCSITLWSLKQGVEHDAVRAAAVVMQGKVCPFLMQVNTYR